MYDEFEPGGEFAALNEEIDDSADLPDEEEGAEEDEEGDSGLGKDKEEEEL